VFGKFEDVLSQERLAAGEYDNRLPHGSNLIQDFPALFGAQLAGVGTSTGCGPAVNAVQIAISRDFPGYKPRLVAFVLFMHTVAFNSAKENF